MANHITLDELLEQAGVSKAECVTFKEVDSLWFPYELLSLSGAEIVTKPQYCSKTAWQALYMIVA